MPQSTEQKSYAEKIKETVHLLKQLQGMKIYPEHLGYSELKGHMDRWIKEDLEFQGQVDFPQHYRRAHVDLSNSASKTANIHLKHHEPSNKE
jgi:hypothetical protein